MSSIPVEKIPSDGNRSRHRQSPIPRLTSRPTSVLAKSPKKPSLSTATDISSSASLRQSTPTGQARNYSRTQRSSLPLGKPTPSSSHESPRESLPRSDSLLPYNQRPTNHGLSGVRQQLHIRNCSTNSLASVDTTLSSNKNRTSISLPLPTPRSLPKSNTLTSLTKPSLNLTPQRQLMKPIDPPLPRSQTMGRLSCFAGDGAKETPSPLKSDSNSLKPGNDKEIGVIEVLQESRMTDHEVEIYKQVMREAQMNKQRIQQIRKMEKPYSTTDARECSDSYSTRTELVLSQAEIIRSPRASKRFGKIDMTKNEEMDLKLLRRDRGHRNDDRRLPTDGTTSRDLYIDTLLADLSQQRPTSLTTPESGILINLNPNEEREVEVKLVYVHQEINYWTGRFSALCDHLKTVNARLGSSNFGAALDSPNFQEVINIEEPFELADCRRTECALKHLRSYCRTNTALRGFEEFETQLREQLEKSADAQRNPARGLSTRFMQASIPGNKPKSEFKPKFGWHFTQSQISNIDGKMTGTGGAAARRQGPMIIKSKTTSNLASILDGEDDSTATSNTNTCSISDAKSLPGLTWQRPTVHEVQAQAKRVREQRVFAKAVVYRGVSGQECGGGRGRTNKTTNRHDSGVGKVFRGDGDGDGAGTNSEELVGGGVAQGWPGIEPPSANEKPAGKGRHSRKSSGADSLSLKKVLSDSMKGMRKIRRSFTGSGSASGNERFAD